MVEINFVDGDKEIFESKKGTEPWEWISEQQAYLIPSINGNVVIPSAFVKCLKHYDVNLEN